jgi:DNA-binding response OmpR family regulator
MRVLLIEDDPQLRGNFVEMLHDGGFDVDGLANAEDALVLLGAGQIPDVLVTDINLGLGLDGIELANMARAKHPEVGVVFITGGPIDQQRYRLREHEQFLQKPFSYAELIRSIQGTSAATFEPREGNV